MGNTVAKNTSFLMVSGLVSRCLGFAISVVLARMLGPDSYGQYSFVIALVTLVALFWNFGLNTIVTREISSDTALTGKYIYLATILKSVLFVPAIFGLLLYLRNTSRYSGIIIPVILFVFSRYFLDISAIFSSAFSGHRRMGVPAILNIIRPLVIFFGISLASQYGIGLNEVFSLYTISSVVVVIIGAFYVRTLCTSISWCLNIKSLINVMVSSMIFFIISALSITLFRVDQLILAEFSTDRELGLYGAAYTVFEVVISFFPMIVMSATFPVLSNLYQIDPKKMKDFYLLILKYFCIIGVPASCGVVVLSPIIMIVLFGQDYADGGAVLQVLGYAIILYFLTILMSWTLTAGRHQRLIMVSTSLTLALNVVLNFLLIPKWGAMAAAYTTLFCELFQFSMFLLGTNLLSWRDFKPNRTWIRIGISTAIMLVAIVSLKEHVLVLPMWFSLILQISIGSSIYLVGIISLGALNKNELRSILKA